MYLFLRLFGGEVVASDGAGFHDEFHGLQDVDVGERVAGDGDEVGEVAGFEGADFVSPAKEICGVDCGGLDSVERLHAPLGHFGELLGVVAVRIDTSVGAESHLCTGLIRVAEILALQAAEFLFLFDGLGEHACFLAFLENVIVVVNVEDEIGAMFLGELDAFFVDQAGMLDGVDASVDGVLDGLCAVGVGGDFAAEFVGFGGDGLKFFEGILRRAREIALAENPSGRANLDDVGSVLDDVAHFGAGSPGTIGNAEFFVVIFIGKQIVVAVAAGDAERRARGAHARAFDVAIVDGVAESDVGETSCADVADGGKTGAQSQAGIFDAGDGFARNGDAEACVTVGGGIGGEMCVDVNKAGETGGGGKIDGRETSGKFCGGSGADGEDGPEIVEDDDLIGERMAGADVEEFAAADGAGDRESERGECQQGEEGRKKFAHESPRQGD